MKKCSKAFTFIEILVVTAIISLLTGSSTVVYTSFSNQSRDARRKADLEQIRSALETYKSNKEDGNYPASLSFGSGSITDGASIYLNKIPQDPKPGASYSYQISGTTMLGSQTYNTSYILSANLEDDTKYCVTPYTQSVVQKGQSCGEFAVAVIPPTSTPAPIQPTNTPIPLQPTNTPIPQPTNTPIPQPTNTPIPTNTPTPAPQPITFSYTGSVQTYTVPQGVSSLTIEAWGAQGGSGGSSGGLGGYAKGTISVSPGEILNVLVGGTNGFNGGAGGGPSNPTVNDGYRECTHLPTGGIGGGASDIRKGGINFANRIIVAGGGGGGGAGITQGGGNVINAYGGAGGGTSGSTGGYSCSGGGGTQTGGGYGSSDDYDCSCQWYSAPASGTLGNGGIGGAGYCGLCGRGGGGGGGGYYGGGGGNGPPGGGGGGGSSYVTGTNTVTTSGVQTGNGQVIITPLY